MFAKTSVDPAARGVDTLRYGPMMPVGLPVPQIQIFGGGAHARGRCDLQDYMIICIGAGSFAAASSIASAMSLCASQMSPWVSLVRDSRLRIRSTWASHAHEAMMTSPILKAWSFRRVFSSRAKYEGAS